MTIAADLAPSRLPSRLVPFIWLFLATMMIKMDNEEAIHPFFSLVVFAALPFALLHLAQCAMRARLTIGYWLILIGFGYLILYPFATMAFDLAKGEERQIKDALYIFSISAIFFFFARRYFLCGDGRPDIPALGRFIVSFALLESVIAVLMFLGLSFSFGFGLEFKQAEWLDNRLHGIMGTPSHLAPVVVVAILFLATRRLDTATALKLAFLFVVLVMTGSRGALAGLFGAVCIYLLTHVRHVRLRLDAILPIVLGATLVSSVVTFFPTHTEEILQMALRSDPDDWEKSRPVMWVLRIAEFVQADPLTQLFGAGHQAVGQTFNVNIEYLLNYGTIYTFVFNILYGAVVLRFFLRAVHSGDADHAFLLILAVSTYLFMQGLNPTFYAFIHVCQFSLIIMLIAYFERSASHRANGASPTTLPDQFIAREGM